MFAILRKLHALGLLSALSSIFLLSACHQLEIGGGCNVGNCRDQARVCEKPTVRALAEDLDHLERHIERYGSVTVQHPTVWGQARLTKHREEFEKVMQSDLCRFETTLQGAPVARRFGIFRQHARAGHRCGRA